VPATNGYSPCSSTCTRLRDTVRAVGSIRDDQLDPAFRDRLLDAFKNFG
jgi:hypothetical protein